jgi:ketosteroid isomerase-like protein
MAESTHARAQAAVLDANASFYRAFTDGDFAAMSEIWAQRTPVTCLHPGARAVVGRSAVLDTWRQILGGPSRLKLRCDQAVVLVTGETAIVTGYEGSNDDPAHLAATNVFVLEDGHWRMVHHHAGPISRPVPRPGPSRSVN